jgi:lipoate-protein ligase B
MLEEVLIRTLACWDINGYRIHKAPGIWTRSSGGEVKIASVGARIEQGITLHGFALNVELDLSPFVAIVPCGLDRCRMTSMADILQIAVCIQMVGRHIAQNFSSVFQLEWTSPSFDIMTPAQCDQRPTLAAQAEA